MKKLAIVAASILAATSFTAAADEFNGANVHAEFERTVPTVCKIEAVADNSSTDSDPTWGVHGTGKLLFKGEEFEATDAMKFKFTSNAGDGTGYISLVNKDFQNSTTDPDYDGDATTGVDAGDFNVYVKNDGELPTVDEAGIVVGQGVTVQQGEISVYARLNTDAGVYKAGEVIEADAFLNAASAEGNGPELDCGVNTYIYKNHK